MMRPRSSFVAALPLLFIACGGAPTEAPTAQSQEAIVRGEETTGLDQVVLIQAQRSNGTTRCSGTYIAPRVVLTAAHCIKSNTLKNGVFVYFGDDYAADVSMLPNVPAPGQTSPWARVETWQVNPNFSASLNYPDLAVLYLDRKLPFEPMPMLPEPVGKQYVGEQATIAGWGAMQSLDANLTQTVGVGVKRVGHATIVGSPTEADYHPEDPNAGMLDPNIRKDLLKLDGHAPSANPCAGDSGGPLIIKKRGKNYLAGVSFWTGLFCEDYSVYVRVQPFFDYIAKAVAAAGALPIKPNLACVGENPDNSLTAYFGYQNNNGLTVSIPFGFANAFLPAEAGKQRPSSFGPGTHSWAFGADFKAGQKLFYELLPPFGPLTLLKVDQKSPRCDTADTGYICASQCRATLAAPCGTEALTQTFEQCMKDCVDGYDMFFGCENEWSAYLQCTAKLSSDPNNWMCMPDFVPQPMGCDDALSEAFICEGY
jgi:hypothetical protein